jgi:hypothetical protein
MHRRSLRSIAAVAAIAALSLTAAAGSASAAKPATPAKSPRTLAHARTLHAKPPALRRALRLAATDIARVRPTARRVPASRAIRSPLGPIAPITTIDDTVVLLKGKATGNGPATDDDCEKIADAAGKAVGCEFTAA